MGQNTSQSLSSSIFSTWRDFPLFPLNTRCPLEFPSYHQALNDSDNFTTLFIPISGLNDPLLVDHFSNIWLYHEFNETKHKSTPIHISPLNLITRPHPYLRPSFYFSIIELNDHVTLDRFVSTSTISIDFLEYYKTFSHSQFNPASIIEQYPLGTDKLSQTSQEYQILHTMFLRLLYYQYILQNKIIYWSPVLTNDEIIIHNNTILPRNNTILPIRLYNNKQYVIICHPEYHSSLGSISFPRVYSQNRTHFFCSLDSTNFRLQPTGMNLSRSQLSFINHFSQVYWHFSTAIDPLLSKLPRDIDVSKSFQENQNRSLCLPQSTQTQNTRTIIMPFSLLYLNCFSEQSVNCLYSFIIHHLLCQMYNSALFNTKSPIIIILQSSGYLDSDPFLTEHSITTTISKYLTIDSIILHEGIQRESSSFIYPTATLELLPVSTLSLGVEQIFTSFPPSNEVCTTYCALIDTLNGYRNDAMFNYVFSLLPSTPLFLSSDPSPSIIPSSRTSYPLAFSLRQHNIAQYNYITTRPFPSLRYPIFRQSPASLLISLFQQHYSHILEDLQWNMFQSLHVIHIPLQMLTIQINVVGNKDLRIQNRPQLPLISPSCRFTEYFPNDPIIYPFFNSNSSNPSYQPKKYLSIDYFVTIQLPPNHSILTPNPHQFFIPPNSSCFSHSSVFSGSHTPSTFILETPTFNSTPQHVTTFSASPHLSPILHPHLPISPSFSFLEQNFSQKPFLDLSSSADNNCNHQSSLYQIPLSDLQPIKVLLCRVQDNAINSTINIQNNTPLPFECNIKKEHTQSPSPPLQQQCFISDYPLNYTLSYLTDDQTMKYHTSNITHFLSPKNLTNSHPIEIQIVSPEINYKISCQNDIPSLGSSTIASVINNDQVQNQSQSLLFSSSLHMPSILAVQQYLSSMSSISTKSISTSISPASTTTFPISSASEHNHNFNSTANPNDVNTKSVYKYHIKLVNHLSGFSTKGVTDLKKVSHIALSPGAHPGICLVSHYNPKNPIIIKPSKDILMFQQSLRTIDINTPLFIVTVLPAHFDVLTSPLPLIHVGTTPQLGWIFTPPPNAFTHGKSLRDAERQLDNELGETISHSTPHSPEAITFHHQIILQYMKHTEQLCVTLHEDVIDAIDKNSHTSHFSSKISSQSHFYWKTPSLTLSDSQSMNVALKQRVVYHFIVNGMAGYLRLLPYINQIALAQYFSLGYSFHDS